MSGDYEYEGDDLSFTIDWWADGGYDDPPAQHKRLLEALGEQVEPLIVDALDIGDHIRLEDVELRLSYWNRPDAKVWFRIPGGYVDSNEEAEQRQAFNRGHNHVHSENLYVDGRHFPVDIDVRPF